MAALSPAAVARAFGVEAEVVALAGGEGLSFRVGTIVVKRVHDESEAVWIQDLLARVELDGFRVATPVATDDGAWIVDGWSASQFIPGLEPVAPRWLLIVEWGLRFGAAADRALTTDHSALEHRTHRWSIADRVAWGEAAADLSAEAAGVHEQLADLLIPQQAPERRFVHGDLTGNVFLDPRGCPVILDVSPYLRHPRWAGAIVIGDAVMWHGAPSSLARDFASDPHNRSLLGRALIFRLVAEQLASNPRHGADLAPYRRLIAALS